MNIREQINQLVLQRAVLNQLQDVHKEYRAALDSGMSEGDRLVAHTSAGVKLGTVTKTSPKPAAVIADLHSLIMNAPEDAFTYIIDDLCIPEIVDVLKEHAPRYLRKVIKDTYLNQQAARALEAFKEGSELPPGYTIEIKAGHLQIKPTEGAADLANQALSTMDVKQLEAGNADGS